MGNLYINSPTYNPDYFIFEQVSAMTSRFKAGPFITLEEAQAELKHLKNPVKCVYNDHQYVSQNGFIKFYRENKIEGSLSDRLRAYETHLGINKNRYYL